MGVPEYLTSLLRNLYAEATVRTRHETAEWSKIGKGIRQGCTLSSSCLFNLHAEYIIQNAWLNESQAGIKIVGTNINHLRYANETKEELKSLLMTMRVKDESEKKKSLKLNITKTKIMASSLITSWQIEGGNWKQ